MSEKLTVFAEMPSNIALIKYMGKVKGENRNQPTNASLSLTLDHLLTRVEISASEKLEDSWAPLKKPDWQPVELSEKGIKRYLSHFQFLKERFCITGQYLVQSANNFPADCGIASSASSFAALTVAAYELGRRLNPNLNLENEKLADLSRQGSGSSIRSFSTPFVRWDEKGISKVSVSQKDLIHQVVIVSAAKKAVSSSEAHERVTSSLLFNGRIERAEKRLSQLTASLQSGDWRSLFEITWAEFWDMHALFATASPPFQYMDDGSMLVLNKMLEVWSEKNDGPIVTMDAGANVHLIYRRDQKELSDKIKFDLAKNFKVVATN